MRLPRAGPSRAEFDRFVLSHVDGFVRTGYLLVGDLAEAEDLVQECLLRVARRWPRVRSMDYPVAYARRILINLAIDGAECRARARLELAMGEGSVLETRVDEAAERRLGVVGVHAELLSALEMLPPRQRVVLVLRYFEDLSEVQVAETLGCSLGTVKSTTSRGLAQLRQALEAAPTPVTDARRSDS
jgi:RNA polymerase sigma-70 factor (sigma-E family)